MPSFRPTPDLDMHYEVDDFTVPWQDQECILMLHGNAESSRAWYAWVPKLARHYRVVRPDMRGFGASTPMPRDYAWTLDRLIDDFCGWRTTLGFPASIWWAPRSVEPLRVRLLHAGPIGSSH